MPERIDGGRALAGVGAVVLLVSLFLSWFEVGPGGPVGQEITAWDVFETLDLVLAFIAIATIVIAIPQAWRAIHGPPLPNGLLAVLGIAAFVIVAAALINHPPVAISLSVDYGAWLAFGGSALMAIGGILGAARITVAISVSPRRSDPEPEPEPETRTMPADRRS